MRLRNGTTVEDPRLDRMYPGVEAHLPSLAYLVSDLPLTQRPFRSNTWRLLQHLDQGQEGRCVEYSICHELLSIPKAVPDYVIAQILDGKLIYWPAQQEDYWPGGSYPGATPQYEGTSVLHGTGVAARLGFYGEYRWAMNVEEMALAVAYGGPVVIGVNWYGGFFQPGTDGFIRIGNSRVEGGHAICVIGVRVVKRKDGSVDYDRSYFKLHNSWGREWGIFGRCYVSWNDMARLIAEEGEIMLPSVRNKVMRLVAA